MIPLLATISNRNAPSRGFRLWIPLFLVWLLPLPLVLVLLPLAFIVLAVAKVNPRRALGAGWEVLTSLTGMHIAVDSFKTSVLIHIY